MSRAGHRRLQERVAILGMQLRYARAHRASGEEISRLERQLAEAQAQQKNAKGSK